DRATHGIAAAHRALRAAVHLDALDVVKHRAYAARTRDVHAVDVQRDRGIADLRVVVGADAADEHFGVALLHTDLQTRNERGHLARVGDTHGRQLALREGRGDARVLLHVLLAP